MVTPTLPYSERDDMEFAKFRTLPDGEIGIGVEVFGDPDFPIGVEAVGPVKFVKDGMTVDVNEDTITQSNNAPLPVKLIGTTGPINITAGDLNVQLSHAGVNYDSTRIGDGANLWAMTGSGEGLVSDLATRASLASIDAKLTNPLPVSAASLPLPAGAATEATLAAFSAKVTDDFGVSSAAVRVAAQIGNATGSAAFGAGVTTAQTIRTVLVTDQSSIPVTGVGVFTVNAPASETTGSASALNGDVIASTDVKDQAAVAIQIGGTFVATVAFQGSNDNVTFFPVCLESTSTPTTGPITSTGSTGMFAGPVPFKYFRARLTAFTSGTATGAIEFKPHGIPYGQGNYSRQLDGAGNVLTSQAYGAQRALDVGVLTDFSDTAAITSVTAATVTTAILAANTARKGFRLFNDTNRAAKVAFAATASSTAFTLQIEANSAHSEPRATYRGAISAIWDAGASGSMRVTELT